jgi:peptidoglycan/LPS O-acetylase OafA/YrhL
MDHVMKYRPEIDGLRAISVLSVFLFHLGDRFAAGGFVGVDVFFVISGYLITTLIYTERKGDRFSLVSFYVRRVKRIAPALLTMILATISAGFLILSPGDYALLARSSLFALGGASNFFFLENTGYFDAEAATMPLLHTWSLGVEEQFYVVWPSLWLVLWTLSRKTKISMLVSIAILIAISLAGYLLTTATDPKTAFYMPYTRAWELGLGGIIPFLPEIKSRSFYLLKAILPWLGIILIGAAVLQFRAAANFTGIELLASAVGAYLIIYATEPNSFIYQILSSKPLVFTGKISYSLYLYHFPMIVLWKHYAVTTTIPREYFWVFIVVAVLISWLSWRYIEQPCRRAKWTWKTVFPVFIALELMAGSVCGVLLITDGAAARIPESVLPMSSLDAMWDWPCPSGHVFRRIDRCTGGAAWDSATAHAVIWGDSNSVHFMPLLDSAARQQGVSISNLYTCAPTVATGYAPRGSAASMEDCDRKHHEALAELSSDDVSLVILAAAWSLGVPRQYGLSTLKEALDRLLSKISTAGRTVVILAEVPKWFDDPIPCIMTVETRLLRSPSSRRRCRDQINSFDKSHFEQFQKATDDMLRSFDGKDGVIVWSPVDGLCSDQSCATVVDGEFIYLDDDHLRTNLKEQTNLDLAKMLRFDDLMKLAKRKPDRTLSKLR